MTHKGVIVQRRSLLATAVTAVALPLSALAPLSPQASAAPKTGRYIVMLAADPVVTADKLPRRAGEVDPGTAAARAYADRLQEGHSAVLAEAGVSKSAKKVDYTVAFNGFTAVLTDDQASDVAKVPGVVKVWEDEVRYSETVTTPDFLGMTGAKGTWARRVGGQAKAGEGVIVGVIDSGYWPESESFAALPEPRPDQAVIDAKWNGTCDTGTEEPVACNNKVIGARYYTTGNTIIDEEFLSPRDLEGHGSHTASTAAGNANVAASINGQDVGTASGMAPAARIAVYKALWLQADGRGSGTTSGLVAAIDDAVADGVDVINYSVSGSTEFVVSPDEVAFFNAAASGVFVSASAGNSGDTVGASSVAHNSPWEITVAASTHNRSVAKTVTLGDGTTYDGVGTGDAVGPAPLVDSEAIPATGVPAADARLCLPDSLDAASAAGKIVVCTRGVNDRVEKSATVKAAGGVGMILVNVTDTQSLNGDYHTVPSIHVTSPDGISIKAYAASANPTAEISAVLDVPVRAPEMAGFSSYGPAKAGGGDLLKPDITAPGVDVIAAVSPPGNSGNNFDAYSGTSMSAPHIAGIGALIRQAHPEWSPMAIKSALMTTASVRDNTRKPIQRGGVNATPLDYGSGHVVPNSAFDPGLVYDSGPLDWIEYGCAIGQFQLITSPDFCGQFDVVDPSDLNTANISVADLAGSQVITRSVTNVGPRKTTYKAQVKAPAGMSVRVSPRELKLKVGETKSYRVTIARRTAPVDEWAFGSLTWREDRGRERDRHQVTSRIAVRPVALAAPTVVSGQGVSGSQDVELTAGYAGDLNTTVDGLVAAKVDAVSVPLDDPDLAGVVQVDVAAGTKLMRVATFDADYAAGTDLDLFLFDENGNELGSSAGPSAEETIELEDADLGGTYFVLIDFFAGAGTSIDAELNSFAVGDDDAGNLVVTPASQSVTSAGAASVNFAWSGLEPDRRYLGVVRYDDGTAEVGKTKVVILP
jgi:subtilisin family serine protease